MVHWSYTQFPSSQKVATDSSDQGGALDWVLVQELLFERPALTVSFTRNTGLSINCPIYSIQVEGHSNGETLDSESCLLVISTSYAKQQHTCEKEDGRNSTPCSNYSTNMNKKMVGTVNQHR